MDARSVLRRLTGFMPLLLLFFAFCAYPVVWGAIERIVKHEWILMDIDAVICGARTLASHHSPYAIHPACAGLRPAAYVYAPQVAMLFAPMVKVFGVVDARTLFIWLLLTPATLFLLWFALIKRFPRVDIRYRWLAFGALTGMTFVCANIAIVMHALVLATLVFSRKSRWPFTIIVLLCSVVKPTFLVYFIVFMLDDMALWRRVLAFGWRCAIGLGIFGLILLDDGRYGGAWQKTLHSVTLTRQPGMGWFALTGDFGIHSGTPLNIGLAVAFMVVMLLSGMAIAQWAKLNDDERIVLVMGLAPLMTPRILDYDMILMVPYAALLVSCAHRFGGKAFSFLVSWLFTGWLIFGIVTFIMGVHTYARTEMGMLLFGILTVVLGLRAVGHGLSGRPIATDDADDTSEDDEAYATN